LTELVETVEQIIRNVETLHSFGNGNPAEQTFHDGRIKNGKVFVAVKRDNVLKFSPSKFAGYIQNDLSHEAKLNERDGRITNNKIEELLGPVVEVDSADLMIWMKSSWHVATNMKSHHPLTTGLGDIG